MTDDVAKLRYHRELGVCLLIDFIQATPETAAGLIERASAWERDLIPLVEPFGDGAAAPFKPLTPMQLHEQLSVMGCAPLDEDATKARVEHAVRMFRLGEFFKQFAPVLPKRAGRKKGEKLCNDTAAITAAHKLLDVDDPPSKRQAALAVVHLADKGASDDAKFHRIYKILRDV